MKKLFLLVLFLVMTFPVFADVSAKIVGVVKDDNGNIEVRTQYKIDGVEVQSRYPQMNGMSYWVTRYNVQNFAGMTKAQILGRIKQDIKSFEVKLIIDKFLAINNDVFVTAGQNIVNATDTVQSAMIYVNTTGGNVLDTSWQVFTDGHKVESPYTP